MWHVVKTFTMCEWAYKAPLCGLDQLFSFVSGFMKKLNIDVVVESFDFFMEHILYSVLNAYFYFFSLNVIV